MLFRLFLLFTIIPLVELWLLFKLSEAIGFFTAIGLVIGTGIVGAALAKWQGLLALHRMQEQMRQGMLPAKAIGDGVMILVAGVLLITPGVLTDVVGLSLLIPPVRGGIRKLLQAWLTRNLQIRTQQFWSEHPDRQQGRDEIIDVEIIDSHVVDENSP